MSPIKRQNSIIEKHEQSSNGEGGSPPCSPGVSVTSQKKLDNIKDRLENVYEKKFNIVKLSLVEEVEELQEMLSESHRSAREVGEKYGFLKQAFNDYYDQTEADLDHHEKKFSELLRENEALKEYISTLT